MATQPTDPRDSAAPTPATPANNPPGDVRLPEQQPTIPPAEASTSSPPPVSAPKRVPSTRVGAMWVAMCATAVVFVALIVFLLQNTRSTQVSFLWMEGSAPLAVTLLIAAVGAALITGLLGTVRIAQLRRVARRRSAGAARR